MPNHITVLNYSSFGQLAELMLLYKKITLFFNEGSLRKMFKQIHPAILIPFFEEHISNINLKSTTWGCCSYYGSYGDKKISFELGDEDSIGVDEPYFDYLYRTYSLDTPDGYIKDEKLTYRLLELIKREYVKKESFNEIFSTELLKNELPDYINKYLHSFPTKKLRDLPKNVKFIKTNNEYEIEIWSNRHLSKEVYESIRVITSQYIRVLSELPIWSNLTSEILANDQQSLAICSKINNAVNNRINSLTKIDSFSEAFFSNKMIKEAINNGDKSFSDFVKLYEGTDQFRVWTFDNTRDSAQFREYYQALISNSWVEKLPSKIVRWVAFTGAGLGLDLLGGSGGVGTVAGITLSAFDAFLLDNLLKGWQPNQFIDKDITNSE